MQIHELNNFTGTLGSGSYLAIDDGNDTGKISKTQLFAATEARIDNIIAGPAPSAEEIVDARLGDDGVTYPSLGDAIRDQVGDLKADYRYWGVEFLRFTNGYIDCNSSTINKDAIISSTGYQYVLSECSEGDIFLIQGVGALSAKKWCFISANGTRLTYRDGSLDSNNPADFAIAPANAAYFIGHNRKSKSVDPFALKVTNRELFSANISSTFRLSIPIESGDDLNTYTIAGNYLIPNVATATAISNTPVNIGGRLTVMTLTGTSAIHQWYIDTNGNWFAREYASGSWTAWQRFVTLERLNNYHSLSYSYTTVIANNSDLDDYVNAGNYHVTSASSALTISNMPVRLGGRLTVITLNSGASVHQWYIDTNGDWHNREFIRGSWAEWKHFATTNDIEKAVNSAWSGKGSYNVIHALAKQAEYDISFANAFIPLTLQNYLDNNQNVHPKVLYFENGFGGHKYWMAYTPYPYSNDSYENPCIAYSDDGIAWTNITGNPLDNPQGVGYDSDTHLVYREDTGTLECWYRYVGDSSQSPREETLYRQTTLNGTTWSEKEVVFSNTSGYYAHLLSPAVIVDNSKYCMWVVNSDGGSVVDYYEAPLSDVTSWTKVRSISFSITDNGISVKPWHLDVIKDGNTYVMLLMCRNGTSIINNACSLFVTKSSDNIDYSSPTKVVGGSDSWDKYMYRSSIVRVGSKYRIYYSAGVGGKTSIYNNAIWGLGITESDSPDGAYYGYYE